LDPAWAYRNAVTIMNTGEAAITGYHVTLDRSFGIAKEKRDGYYRLGSPQTVLVKDQPWEAAAPHTLSVVQVNSGRYTYWGYYGLKDGCGGVGLARSNDLVNWTKFSANPLFLNGRWPSVLKVGSTFYMLYEKDFCATTHINLASSTDGISFTNLKTIVQPESGIRNQNPNLFYNPNDGKYYIYWYRGDETTTWEIKARSAANIADLDNTASEVTVIHSPSRLAAPNLLYYNKTYFLSTEVVDSSNKWNVRIYASKSSPTSGFYMLPGNPVLATGSACLFQHVFGAMLHGYYCKHTDSTWTIEHRAADLAAGRLQFHVP
jgi:beta-xylosidase